MGYINGYFQNILRQKLFTLGLGKTSLQEHSWNMQMSFLSFLFKVGTSKMTCLKSEDARRQIVGC